jgi:hypothetical protein
MSVMLSKHGSLRDVEPMAGFAEPPPRAGVPPLSTGVAR